MNKMRFGRMVAAGGLALGLIAQGAAAHAQALDKNMVRLAKCSGAIIGNAVVEYSLDEDSDRLQRRAVPANYVYLAGVLDGDFDDKQIEIYDNIQSSVLVEYIDAARLGTWVGEDWEYLVGCYETVLEESPMSRNPELQKTTERVTNMYIENLKTLLLQ